MFSMNPINSTTKLRIWAQVASEDPKVLRKKLRENQVFYEEVLATVRHPPDVDETQKPVLAQRVRKIFSKFGSPLPDWAVPFQLKPKSRADIFLKACRKGDSSYIASKKWDPEALVDARTARGGTPLHEFFSHPNPNCKILEYMRDNFLIGDWLLFRDLDGDLPLDRCTQLSDELRDELLCVFENVDSIEGEEVKDKNVQFLKYLCLLKKPDLALANLKLLCEPQEFIDLLKFCHQENPQVIEPLLSGYAKEHPYQPFAVLLYHVDPSLVPKAPQPPSSLAICDEFPPEIWDIEPLSSWPYFSPRLPVFLIDGRLREVPLSLKSDILAQLFFRPENASPALWSNLVNNLVNKFSQIIDLFEGASSFNPALKLMACQVMQSADFPLDDLLRRPVTELAKLLPHLWHFKLECGLLIFERCQKALPELDIVEETLKGLDFENVDIVKFTQFLHEAIRRFDPSFPLTSFYQKEERRRNLFIYLARNIDYLLPHVMGLPASAMKRYFLMQLSRENFFQIKDLVAFLPEETDAEFIATIIRNVFPSKKMPFPLPLLYNTNFVLWDALFKHFEINPTSLITLAIIHSIIRAVPSESLLREVHAYVKRLQLPQEKESEVWAGVVAQLLAFSRDSGAAVDNLKILDTLIDVPLPLFAKPPASWPLAALTFYFERCGDGTLQQDPYPDNSEEALYFSQHGRPVERVQEEMRAIAHLNFNVSIDAGYFQIYCQDFLLFRGYIHKRAHEAFLSKIAKKALLTEVRTTFNLPNHFHRVFETAWFDEAQRSTAVKFEDINEVKAYLYTLDLESGFVVIRTLEAGVDFKTAEEFRLHFEEQDRKIALQREQFSEAEKKQFTLNPSGVYELVDGTKIWGLKNVRHQLALKAALYERLQKYRADGTAVPYFHTISQALDANLPCAVIANGNFALYRLGDTLRAIPCGAIEEGKLHLSRYHEVLRDLKLSQVGANKIAEAATVLGPKDIYPLDYAILTQHVEKIAESLLKGAKLSKAQALHNIDNLIQILNDKKTARGWEDRQKYAKEYFDLKAFLSHALHELKRTENAEGLTSLTFECAKFGAHCGTKLSEVAQQGWLLAFKHYAISLGNENIVITAWKNAMAEFILLLPRLSNVVGHQQQQGHLIAYIRDTLTLLGWKVPPHDAFSPFQNTFGKDGFAKGNEEFPQYVINKLAQGMLPSLLLEKMEELYREQNYDALALLQQKILEVAEKALEEEAGFSPELQQRFAQAKRERSENIHAAKAPLQDLLEKNNAMRAPHAPLIQEYGDLQAHYVTLNQEIKMISEECLRLEKAIVFQQRRKTNPSENQPPKPSLKRFFTADLIREEDDEEQILIAALKKNQEESNQHLQTALQRKTFLEQLISQYKQANSFLETYENMQQAIQKATQDYDAACFNRSNLNSVLEEALQEKGWAALDESTQLMHITLRGLAAILLHEGLFFRI